MKNYIRKFPGTIQCIGSNTKLECNIKYDKTKTEEMGSRKLRSILCTVRQCRICIVWYYLCSFVYKFFEQEFSSCLVFSRTLCVRTEG
jgi:hypothetical protein